MSAWQAIIKKMDGSGPPLKRQIIRKKPQPIVKVIPSTQDTNTIYSDYFDINIHGYRLVKGSLMYKTPDGRLLAATGVDEFGPFKDPPRHLNPLYPSFRRR